MKKNNTLKLSSSYLQLDELFYHKVIPTPLQNTFLISKNSSLLKELNLENIDDEVLISLINGSEFFEGSTPFAMCYAGHQFGHFVPRLGDGRAINLGKSQDGWNFQLKGAGQTRYSRQGDGRAVLRSSIREYLMSEAMFGLNIPTSRALGIIGSETQVAREKWETGSIVMRLSPSWIRFGSFEYFYHTKNYHLLEQLAEFTIDESFPELKEKDDHFFLMFEKIVQKTANLMAMWQSVGFNHGVMNTDNMSISGLTIDYGPYAFLDDFNNHYICNHTDVEGRYSFGNQPFIGKWNLAMLLRALSPLVNIKRMETVLENYASLYKSDYQDIMSKKLGIRNETGNAEFIQKLLNIMQNQGVDYTLFFRTLSRYDGDKKDLLNLTLKPDDLEKWLNLYDNRISEIGLEDRISKMVKTNPKYVLKNYMLQEAIDKAEKGDFSLVNNLLEIAHKPFDEHLEFERYSEATPKQEKNIILSCSS